MYYTENNRTQYVALSYTTAAAFGLFRRFEDVN